MPPIGMSIAFKTDPETMKKVAEFQQYWKDVIRQKDEDQIRAYNQLLEIQRRRVLEEEY
ncbi:MAG: hypothetical protein AABX77_02005 [Nanoarchaeota archaeon]|mgnify:CR=1 FL=1